MKKWIFSLLVILLSNYGMYGFSTDVLYIYKTDSTIVGFPINRVDTIQANENSQVVYVGNSSYSYSIDEIAKVTIESPRLPQFETFHFNDKYNLQLPSNVDCSFDSLENQWFGVVNSIGL